MEGFGQVRRALQCAARQLVTLVGQEQYGLRVIIQMPRVRRRARPAVAFVFDGSVHSLILALAGAHL